jgi:hypothetical protein
MKPLQLIPALVGVTIYHKRGSGDGDMAVQHLRLVWRNCLCHCPYSVHRSISENTF